MSNYGHLNIGEMPLYIMVLGLVFVIANANFTYSYHCFSKLNEVFISLLILSLSQYNSISTPVVFIAVAGRSNGLGPVVAGNTALPVINCPPVSKKEQTHDVWSSLSVPSGNMEE